MISVLYVDDERDLLEVTKLFLELGDDITVTTMLSAKEALDQDIGSFDAIVSDYLMPGMDGIAFLKAVRRQYGDIPFILFTGRGREEVVIEAINNGADSYLQKGADPNTQFAELAHRIHQAVKRRHAEQSLQESEKRLADIINFLPDATFAIDKTGHVIAWNRAIEELTGVLSGDILGKGEYEYAIPLYGKRQPVLIDLIFQPGTDIPDRYANLIQEKDTFIAETTLPRPGDQTITIMVKASPLYNQQGEIVGAIESIRDITELKRATRELQRSEKWFRFLIQNSTDMIRIIGPDGLISYTTPSTKRILGYDPSDLVGKDPFEYLHPDDREPVRRALAEAMQEGHQHSPTEYRIRHADGHYVSVEALANNLLDVPEINGIVITIRPISDRKRVEEEIAQSRKVVAESEEQYKTLFESANDAIFIADRKTFLNCNHSAEELFGCSRDLLINHTLLDFSPELQPGGLPSREIAREKIDAALSGKPLVFEWTHLRYDRTPFDAEISLNRILIGGSYCIQGIVRDITDRKKAEAALRESENKFATVFKYSPVDHTLVSATDGIIIDVNDAFVRNTGYSHEEAIGKTTDQLQLFPDAGEREKLISLFRSGQDISGMLVACRSRSGEIKACLFSARPIVMAGKPHILSTIEDITERKKAEEALQESESKLRRIADNAPDTIFRMSFPEGKYEYISPASLALTGYTPEEFYERPELLRTLIHPSWQEYFRMQWDALKAGSVPPTYEFQIIDRAGQSRWLNQRNMLVTDSEGRTVALEGIVTDITRQKETERELRRNELRSLAVSANAGSWIWEIDPEGIYRYSSPAVLNILGYKPEEIVGRMHFYDLFEPTIREKLKGEVFAAMEGREPFRNLENLNVHKDGRPVLLRTGGTPVFDENGAFAGYCGVDEDITEQRAKEAAFQAIVKSMVGTTGLDSLWQIAESVSSWLAMECVMVGEILPDQKKVRVLAMVLDGNRVEDFSYTLEGTPCEDVRGKGFCYYPDNAVSLFPHAKDIVELNIRSYAGTPLRDSAGNVFGILCALSRNPLPAIPSMQEIMEIIAVKAAAEIKSMQMTRALQESEQKFRSLVEYALEGILITDLSGTVLFANNAAAQTLEIQGGGAALCGRNVMEFVAPESQPDAMRDYTEVAKGHDSYLAQYKVITGKAKEIYIESIGKMIMYEGRSADLISIREITERKRAEEALNRSQQLLAEAMDLAHLVNWEYDVASDLFTFNDRFYALYGTTAEREGGTRMSSETYAREFVHPDDRHMVGEEVKRALTATDPKYFSEIEHRIIRRDGAVRHIVVKIRLEKDADGKTVRTHGANQDITDTRKAEEAVRQSEAKYRLLAENVHDVIFTADMDMRLTYISPSVQVLRGCSPEEAMAQPLSSALTPTSYEVIMRSRETGIEGLKEENAVLPSYTMELEFYRKDGSTVWTETIIALAFDNNRRPAGVVGVIRDITQRKQVENALLESEEKFRSLVETSPGIIWEIDIAGKIHYISPMVKEVLGYEPEGLVGQKFHELVLKQLRPIFLKTLATMASTSAGLLLPFEIIARHRDGRDLVLEIRPSRVTGIDGNVTGFRGVAYDTTRRKKAEEALKRANRQLNLLGSITRHDLLNKITVILGNLKMAEKMCASPEEQEHLTKIRYATNAIKSQIEFTRVYQNLGTHEPQWIALDSVMPRPHVPPSVTMKTEVQDIEILADPMLEKVFFNLIDNSIRHGEHVTEIHVTTRTSGDDLVIVWEDNGAGIDQDDKEHIFRRGFGKNTGLGMFLAREILSLTNILIRETGEPGKGARFEITVPKGAYRSRVTGLDEG